MSEQAVANGSELKNTPPNTPNKKGKKKKKKQNAENKTLAVDISLGQTNWNAIKSVKKRKRKNKKKNDENSNKDGAASTVKDVKNDGSTKEEDEEKEVDRTKCKEVEKTEDEPPIVVPNLDPGRKLLFEQNHIHPLQKKSSKNPNAVFQCKLCKYHCNNIGVVEHHIQDKRHLKAMEEDGERYTIQNIPAPTTRQMELITDVLEAQIKVYGLDDADRLIRKDIVTTLNDSIAEVMPGFIVRMYGSTAMGFALKKSDLNMELCVPVEGNPPKGLAAAYDFISKQQAKYHDVKSDFSAEVPAVRFVTNDTNIHCSLTLSNNHSFKLAELLRKYASVDERVRKLGIVFRLWAHYCKLDNVDLCMWPPYAFSLMLIYFLQQLPSPVLPVLHELVESQGGEYKAEHYLDPEDLEGKWTSENKMSLGELWLKLFKFYTCDFEANVYVVCIEQLRPLPRNENVRRWLGKKIAIRDPFLPKRNVSRSITTLSGIDYSMTCFRNTFKYFAILQTETGPIFQRIERELTEKLDIYCQDIEAKEKMIKKLLAGHHYFMKPVQTPTTVTELENQLFFMAQRSIYNEFPTLVVPVKWAREIFSCFNGNYLRYEFLPLLFIGNQEFPEICSLCQKEGHYKENCQEEIVEKFEVTLPPMEDYYKTALDNLCEQVLESWEILPDAVELRKKITAEIEEYLQQFYPTAKLELFGSSCNGFGLSKSDIDICLTFIDSENGKEHDFVKLIEEMQEKLKKYGLLQNLVPITTAKVPILKFFHVKSALDGDISIYNTLGKQNTRLLKTYADIDRRAKMLGYMIKRFGKVCEMCDASRGSLSSYAYIIMLIYFLQQCDPPVLPVLQELSETDPKPEIIIEDCDTYFYDNISNLNTIWPEHGKNTCSVGELWIQLLHFYSTEFDFSTHVISIRKKERLLRFEKMWTSKCMAIEDPFDLSHNLGAGLSRKMHCYIINSFRNGYMHFGTCKPDILRNRGSLENYFFRSDLLVIGDPPNDRGCRICKKIGHLCRDCPQRKQNRQKVTHNKSVMRMNPPPGMGPMRNMPPNTVTSLRGYSPQFTAPLGPQPPRGIYRSARLPSFRCSYNFQPQENTSMRYGIHQTLPPFKSCASPADLSRKNGVGNHPHFMTTQGSANVRPHMMFNNGQLNPSSNNSSPRVEAALRMTHEQTIQECQILAERLGLYPRDTRIDMARLKPPGFVPQPPPEPKNVVVYDIPPD